MRRLSAWPWLIVLLFAAACAGQPGQDADDATTPTRGDAVTEGVAGTMRLYTSVTEDTVDAVLAALAQTHPDIDVELFRAPTGELNARLAAEQRSGGVQADVLWATDPLSMYAYDEEGLFLEWTPAEVEAVPEDFGTERFWGTRILNLVIVHGETVEPVPTAWQDLTEEPYRDGVALPDPAFAGSAFAALGYFALEPQFGLDYYRALEENGAVQVQAPDEVITGVAEGRYEAGITLDKSARDAIDDGAPIEMVWPDPGAIALYSPAAVFESTADERAARAFVEFLLTEPAQSAIASTGWQPVLPDVEGPPIPAGAEQVFPDWKAAFGRQDELLEEYRTIFGG